MAEPPRPGRAGAGLLLRAAVVGVVALLLVGGIVGGLLRAGLQLPLPAAAWPGHALLGHAFLMVGAFMGTVIGIERAVALKAAPAFAAPAGAALSGLLLLGGAPGTAALLALAASAAFVVVNIVVLRRQAAAHTALLLLGAVAWLAGNLLLVLGGPPAAVLPWWLGFLVLTIAAERLELTRLMRRRPGAAAALHACLGLMLAGAALSTPSPAWGSRLFGLALVALAAWLVAFDIARRTVRTQGLSRYMAVCLLAGYGWLAVAGLAWMALPQWPAARDTAMHALGLGFVFSMVMGHAPVVLPALARVKLLYGPVFYLPLLLLHASLLLRLAAGPADAALQRAGAAGNAAAIGLFALTMLGAALAWRRRHPPAGRSRRAVAR